MDFRRPDRAGKIQPRTFDFLGFTHYAYCGVTGNSRALGEFLDLARKSWRKWLKRGNNKNGMPWDRSTRNNRMKSEQGEFGVGYSASVVPPLAP